MKMEKYRPTYLMNRETKILNSITSIKQTVYEKKKKKDISMLLFADKMQKKYLIILYLMADSLSESEVEDNMLKL